MALLDGTTATAAMAVVQEASGAWRALSPETKSAFKQLVDTAKALQRLTAGDKLPDAVKGSELDALLDALHNLSGDKVFETAIAADHQVFVAISTWDRMRDRYSERQKHIDAILMRIRTVRRMVGDPAPERLPPR